MRLFKAGLLLVVISGLCAASLHAFEPGDFAPRGSLLYARASDLSGSLGKLGGDAWKAQAERMLLARTGRDVEESEPVIAEIRRFVDYLGTTEFVISDVMLREPYMQMALIAQLKEGAPQEFSKEFLDFIKKEGDDAEVTATSVKFENGSFWLKGGVLVLSSGGMMDAHVQDVLEGYTDESLSKVERFSKWSAKAKGDIVLFADMKAWRTAVDRLGEDFDRELRFALDTVEWQKWDLITGSAMLPGKTGGGISVDLALSLNQPFEHVNAFLKPSGGSRLINMLPAETVGFLSMQLGRDHQRTLDEMLRFFHDTEQNSRPTAINRRIHWAESDLKYAEERLARLKEDKGDDNDKDARGDAEPQNSPPVPPPNTESGDGPDKEYDPIKDAQDEIARCKQELADLQDELAKFKYRAFQPDMTQRQGKETDAEEFSDDLDDALGKFDFTREEVLQAIGQEVMFGIIDLPDPGFDGNDPGDAYDQLWFALVETQDTFPELKDRFLDRLLARKLPADMSEEDKAEAKRRAEKGLFKKVDGGELIREKGLRADWCAFAGEGFVGIAPNEEIALRILKAGLGQGRLATSGIPAGGVSGSKFCYLNLGAILGKVASGVRNRDRRDARFPDPYFDLAKYLPAGFHLSISTDESSQGVLLSARTGGEGDAGGALEMFADEIANMKAGRHDEDELETLRSAVEGWYSDNRDALAAMEVGERTQAIKAITPQALITKGLYAPLDGLRSAFDPALKDRFQQMLEAHNKRMGPAKGVEDHPGDLSESSFQWFGLPADMSIAEGEGYSHESRDRGGVPVCALKGDWAHDGRFVLMWHDGLYVQWLDAADYTDLLDAIRNGKPWTPADHEADDPPKWRVRKMLRNQQYQMVNLGERIRQARDQANAENREFKPKFNGKDNEDPAEALRKLLGADEDDWFYFEGGKNLTIDTDAAGKITARYERWGEWIQIDDEGNVTSSMDD